MNANAVKSSGQEIELQALRDALQTRLDELLPPGQERDLVWRRDARRRADAR